MTGVDVKEDLHSYLPGARETLLWKLDGLGEYDMRRPLTATGIADDTIVSLPLDAVGQAPWWGADGAVTLHRVLVHVTAETQRHAGHADIVRELIDGSAGLLAGHDNLPSGDPEWWRAHRDRVEAAARLASGT